MSGGLFGRTNTDYISEYTYIPTEQLKAGEGYNVLRADHEPIYKETKDKFQELYQPIKEFDNTKDLKPFTINDIGRTMHGSYGLNASYYNSLIKKQDDKPYGTEIHIPPSYPNHYYNTRKFSPVFVALHKNS